MTPVTNTTVTNIGMKAKGDMPPRMNIIDMPIQHESKMSVRGNTFSSIANLLVLGPEALKFPSP